MKSVFHRYIGNSYTDQNNNMCRECGKHRYVGNRYAAFHELGRRDLMCKFCQKIEKDKDEVQAKKNRRKCFWFGHRWGNYRLHKMGLVQYCQRSGCNKEHITFTGYD